ncbi:MAG: tRNA epoxyqueuosine(34) reductase QueG, partial [Dehalococcoidia bacterium]
MDTSTITASLKREALALGFAACAVAPASPLPDHRSIFEQRIARGSYDGLPWFTAERAARSTDPGRALDQVRSVITLAAPYRATMDVDADTLSDRPRGRIARYAWGRDYHRALERPLKRLAGWLAEAVPGCRSRFMVDYGPLAERAFAARGGLGWFGKSTNLLTPVGGSWVLLADVLTTADLEPDPPLKKTCGACIRCVAACPTGAIVDAYDLDNRLCISFQTIEQRGPIPRPLRPLLGDWLFGCDVCQDACPVPSRTEAMLDLRPASLDAAVPPLIPLLSLTDDQFRQRFAGRPLMRAKRDGLLRNACIALANIGDDRAVPALTGTLNADPSPLVRGHAAWALGRFGARHPLDIARRREPDAFVCEELEAALAGDGAEITVPRQQPLTDWLAGRRWEAEAPSPDPSPAARWRG